MPKESIPSKDRSQYSQTKYKFFLEEDAPIRSNRCCNVIKKEPAHRYSKQTKRKPILGVMAQESRLRTQKWLANGCNGFDMKSPVSNPMSFWMEQDVLLYIKENNLKIASVYGDIVRDNDAYGMLDGQLDMSELNANQFGIFDLGRPILKTTGCNRTGCMFCGYGCHLGGDDRFVRMKETHPEQYDYIMRPWEQEIEVKDPNTGEVTKVKQYGLNYKEVIDWINEHGNLNIKY